MHFWVRERGGVMATQEGDEFPSGDGPRSPWAQPHFGRSVAVVALGVSAVLTGAWLGLSWLGVVGIVLALLGGHGLLHAQIEWREDVADSFSAPRSHKRSVRTHGVPEDNSDERRPNDR